MNSNVELVPIPPNVALARTDHQARHIGPPPGLTEDECGVVEALIGVTPEGYPAFRDYWRPSPTQLEELAAGGCIELTQYTGRMVMHSMTVWPAS